MVAANIVSFCTAALFCAIAAAVGLRAAVRGQPLSTPRRLRLCRRPVAAGLFRTRLARRTLGRLARPAHPQAGGLGTPVGPSPYSQIRGNSRRDRVRSGMREFESSHSSQAVTQLKIVSR
jgi:hypothetical protein